MTTQDHAAGESMQFNASSPAGNYGDDPKFKRLPKSEQWQIMAANGDVRSLLQDAPHAFGARIQMDSLCRCVHDAIEKFARDDPAAFASFLQNEMLAGAGMMVIRAQYLLNNHLRRQHDEREVWLPDQGDPDKPDKLAAAVTALNAEVAKLLNLSASTQLTIERMRKLRLANDKAEAKKNRPRQPRRRRISPRPQQPMTPSSRIGGDLP
jgi:hypothetical protein